MFDIGGVELMVIAAVAILVVGPRELPAMLRSVGRFVKQARQMTSSVQRQFNDALREAELDDVKQTIDDVRSLNPARQIKQTIAREMRPLTDAGNSVKKAVGTIGDEANVAVKSASAKTTAQSTATSKSAAAAKTKTTAKSAAAGASSARAKAATSSTATKTKTAPKSSKAGAKQTPARTKATSQKASAKRSSASQKTSSAASAKRPAAKAKSAATSGDA
ncbi:MAG: Sec-independent protein translocase protein TatB [Pseudomonadota bacterium]